MLAKRQEVQKAEGKRGKDIDTCVNREVLEIATRGTYQAKHTDEASELTGYEPKFILAYKK